MKKVKVLVATVLASGLVLSGCTFEEGLEMAKSWANNSVAQPVVNFWNEKILGKKPQEPEKEKEEKEEEGEKPAPAPVAQLLSISVSGQYKSEYEVGESFDASGIVVTAAYDDGSTQDVSSQASFSGFSSEQAGPCTVTVSFEGQTATFNVTVVAPVRTVSFPEFEALFEEAGIENAIPGYPSEAGVATYTPASSGSQTVYVYVITGSSHAEMDAYAGILADIGWLLAQDSYGDYSGSFGSTRGRAYIGDYIQESFGGILVQFYLAAPPASVEFPSEQIAAYLASIGVTDSIPEFTGEALGFTFTSSGAQLQIQVNPGDEADAIAQYGQDLINAGYSEAGVDSYGDMHYASPKGEIDACAWDGNDASTPSPGYVFVDFEYTPPFTWPAAEIAEFLESLFPGTETVLPPVEDATSYKIWTSLKEIDFKGPTSVDGYEQTLLDAGWTASPAAEHTFISPNEDIQVKLTFSSYYGLEVHLSAYVAPLTAWPADAIADAFETANKEEFAVPALEGDGFLYEVKDSYVTSDNVLLIYVAGTATEADLTAYLEVLEEAGWTVSESGTSYTATKANENGVQRLYLGWSSTNNEITIQINLALEPLPAAEWPTSEVAAYLGNSVTDVLPAFEGEASAYQFFADYGTVLVTVGEGNESAAITAYQATLGTALFTLYGQDGDGDNIYLSPNKQFIAGVYYYDAGQIAIYMGESPFSSTFPVDKVNAFLSARSFGFQLTASMFADLNIDSYEYRTGYSGYYPYVSVSVEGDHVSEFQAIIVPVIEAAGFELDSSDGIYYNFLDSDVEFEYANGVTTVYFQY